MQVAQRWVIRLPQQLLAELGTGTLLSVLTLDAPPGDYGVRVGITQPVAASRGQWEGNLEITSGEGAVATAAAGRMSIPVDAAGTQQLALLTPRDGRFPQGSSVYVLVWARGGVPSLGDVSVDMVSADGTSVGLELESSRWVGGSAGPLVIESRFPEVAPGDYTLQVDLGPSFEVNPVAVRIDR